MRIILISIMISLFWVGNASAKDIAQCGKSKGYAFYPKYGYASTQKDVGKWIADGISKGRFTISLLDNGKYDVLFVDSNGGITSSVRDSGIVILVGKTKNSLSLMVSYPNISVETYSVYLKYSLLKDKLMCETRKIKDSKTTIWVSYLTGELSEVEVTYKKSGRIKNVKISRGT
jgi:hypothetical protein